MVEWSAETEHHVYHGGGISFADGKIEIGTFCCGCWGEIPVTREQLEELRDALDRWINEGGK